MHKYAKQGVIIAAFFGNVMLLFSTFGNIVVHFAPVGESRKPSSKGFFRQYYASMSGNIIGEVAPA
ncbi:MAG: hypothetical protein P4N59_30515 [Negativicutes bacterium]|nr:hypothetical protein [Negativicutes bacterium]